MKSWQDLKARATEAVKSSVERIQQARRQYYGENAIDPILIYSDELAPHQGEGEAMIEPDPVLEHLLRKARSLEVREQFLLIPFENYTTHHQVKVLAATYNVNGRPPPDGVDLSPWLGGGCYADIVAVGFQEIVPLNATNVVLGATLDAAMAWDAQVSSTLNGTAAATGNAAPEGRHSPSASISSSHADTFVGKTDAAGGADQLLTISTTPVGQEDRGTLSIDELLGITLPPQVAGTAAAVQASEGMVDSSLTDVLGGAEGARTAEEEQGGLAEAATSEGTGEGDGYSTPQAMPALDHETVLAEAASEISGEGEEEGSSEKEPGNQSRAGQPTPSRESDGAAGGKEGEVASPDSAEFVQFVQIAARQMVGVYLSVWARRSLLPHIQGVQVLSVATGALGYFGNKGAVAVRLRVYDSGFCFVNAHFSSGEAEGDELRRNYDYTEVVRRGYFPSEDSLQAMADAQGMTTVLQPFLSGGHWGACLHILDCEHVIWVGDLNYRLQGMQSGEVLAAIQKGELDSLLARDQLRLMMRSKQAFHGWQERHITFPPTFKLKRGTSQYLGESSDNGSNSSRGPSSADLVGLQDVIKDESSSMTLTASQAAFEAGSKGAPAKPEKEKVRTPAWTDRILWRTASPGGMQQLTYMAAEGVTVSDHRPVSGAFFVQAREYVREQVDAALEVARRVADAREMASVPHVAAQPTTLDLGVLEYGQLSEHALSLVNTAQAPANFKFVPVPGTQRVLPAWLSAHPSQGCVPMGGHSSILLRACVAGGPTGAAECVLAEQQCVLDSILVLRVEGGNDIFLSLTGRYTPSCFGLSWNTLASLPRPVSTSPSQQQLQQASGIVEVGGDTFFDPLHSVSRVPPELVRLTDLLRHNAWLATPGLFVKASDLATAAAAWRLSRLSSSGREVLPGGHFVARTSSMGSEGAAWHSRLSRLSSSGEGVLFGAAACGSPRQRHQLGTAGLLRFSSDGSPAAGVLEEQPGSPTSPTAAHRQEALLGVRRALDSGTPFPESVDAHDASAALLAFFADLPHPFMPPDVVQVCDVCIPLVSTAASLLVDSMSATELAVLCHMLLLMVEVLAPENRSHNGLSPASLAAILAEMWFPAIPPAPTPTAAQALARGPAGSVSSPSSVAEISMRQIEFVQLLLEDESVLQTLCAAL